MVLKIEAEVPLMKKSLAKSRREVCLFVDISVFKLFFDFEILFVGFIEL